MSLQTLFQQYHTPFLARYGQHLNADQRSALHAIEHCRTDAGKPLHLHCQACGWDHHTFVSCGHRACPHCQHQLQQQWLSRQQQKLLPTTYFMVTFTLPKALRPIAWQHPRLVYALLFHCARDTLNTFAQHDKQLRGALGMTAVLHTHSRQLNYHPHVHCLVPGAALDSQRKQWRKLKRRYLFNAKNLAKVFRRKFLCAARKHALHLPEQLPTQWVAHCKRVGHGLPALKYLSCYLYRGVISENAIISNDGTTVAFRYRNGKTGETNIRRLRGERFVWLVLQHVLPKGFRRVRDYGFLHANAALTLRLMQLQVCLVLRLNLAGAVHKPPLCCPQCHQRLSITIGFVPKVPS